jgi:hypothetical protein
MAKSSFPLNNDLLLWHRTLHPNRAADLAQLAAPEVLESETGILQNAKEQALGQISAMYRDKKRSSFWMFQCEV